MGCCRQPPKTLSNSIIAMKEDRMDICRSCEWFRPSIQQCKKCGCIMAFKTKLKGASCPIGKW